MKHFFEHNLDHFQFFFQMGDSTSTQRVGWVSHRLELWWRIFLVFLIVGKGFSVDVFFFMISNAVWKKRCLYLAWRQDLLPTEPLRRRIQHCSKLRALSPWYPYLILQHKRNSSLFSCVLGWLGAIGVQAKWSSKTSFPLNINKP